jgi:hypothetical protein
MIVNMPIREKIETHESIPSAMVDFLKDVALRIENWEPSTTTVSDDLLQCDHTYGGLYDAENLRDGFEHFPTGDVIVDGIDITWHLDFDASQIRMIACGELSELVMWRCRADCGRRFGASVAYCPPCDFPT